jgi:hypothetical protein
LPLTVTAFDQLKALAEHPSLHLQSLTYGGGDLPANAELTVAKGNYVVWTGTALPAKVTVQSGWAINLAAGVTSAGDITLIGGGRELKRVSSVAVTGGGSTTYPFTLTAQPVLNENNASTFNNRLATLTIGDGKEKTDVTIGDVASFAPVTGEIIVKQNASLTVGGSSTTTIDIPGTITLEKGDAADTGGKFATASTLGSLSGASFGSTVKIDIGEHASFDTSSLVNQATFAKLRNLTVNGTLTVTSTGATGTDSATLFDALEKTKGSAGDVGGSGSANFPGWVVGTAKEHAFDQILGITNVRIKSTDILKNTSGFDSDHTSDGGTATGTPTLTVDAITILGEGLTVDRNLNVTSDGTITFPSTTASLTISKGISISANGGLVLSAPSGGDAVLVANGGNTVITAPATGTGVFNTGTAGGLTLKSGTLNIPGQLIITEGSLLAGGADAAAGQLSLAAPSSGNDTYVKNVTIAPATGSAVTLTINEEGELSNGAASSVGKGSSIAAGAADVQIIGAASSALSFIGAAVGEGTLKASAGGAAIKATEVTDTSAAPPTTGEAQITGEWEAVDGAAVLTGGTASGNEILTISGNVTVAVGGSAYDTAKLGGGSTLAKEVVFNADAGKITLGTDSTLTGGNLTTTGKGVFEFATGGNTLKTGGGSLTIGSAVLVAGGIQQGTLNLTTGVLAIGSSGFKVGDDTKFTTNLTAAPASPAEIVLSVNGGTIQNGGAITLLAITDAAAAKSRKGKLSIGSTYALETYDTTDSTKTLKIALTTGTAKEGGGSGAGAVTVETTANDLYGDFSGKATSDSNPTPALTATLGSKVELDGKNIKINSGTGNSITSTSLVYTNLVPKP